MNPKRLYRIRDNVAQLSVGPIILAHRDAQAMRDFTQLLADKTTMVGQHPRDFDLIHIGYVDEDTSKLTAIIGDNPIIMSGNTWADLAETNNG